MAKVLVVDDSAFMRNFVKKALIGEGHTIIGEASDGLEAFEAYKKLKPDLVMMDITMPKTSGLSSLKLIINHDKNAKVIMCSAMGQKSLVLEALQLGAKEFIVKPFNPYRMNEAIYNSLSE